MSRTVFPRSYRLSFGWCFDSQSKCGRVPEFDETASPANLTGLSSGVRVMA